MEHSVPIVVKEIIFIYEAKPYGKVVIYKVDFYSVARPSTEPTEIDGNSCNWTRLTESK